MQSRSAKHATDGSTSHRFFTRFPKPRTSRKRRQGPILETLETRTLLSITASLNTATQVLTFNQATSNDQLTLYETDVDNSGTIDGFAAVYDDGIAPPLNSLLLIRGRSRSLEHRCGSVWPRRHDPDRV